jgi:hypothetical protein
MGSVIGRRSPGESNGITKVDMNEKLNKLLSYFKEVYCNTCT